MRIRTIKPEWLEDEKVLGAGSDARVLSIGLILLADDYGNGRGNELWLASQVFPMEPDPLATFRESLVKLLGWFATVYEVRGQRYFHIRKWSDHQRVDKPGKPRVPGPDDPEATIISGTYKSSRESRESLAKVPESLAPDLDLDLDHDHDHEGTRASPPSDSEPEDLTWQRAGRLWLEALKIPSHGFAMMRHHEALVDIVRLARTETELLRVLGHYRVDPWVQETKPAPSHLAGNWHKYLAAPQPKGGERKLSLADL